MKMSNAFFAISCHKLQTYYRTRTFESGFCNGWSDIYTHRQSAIHHFFIPVLGFNIPVTCTTTPCVIVGLKNAIFCFPSSVMLAFGSVPVS